MSTTTTTASRPQKRSRVDPPTSFNPPPATATLSLDMIEAPAQSMLPLPSQPQTTMPESWASFDVGQAMTPSAFLPPTSSYDYSTQPPQDAFPMGDYLQSNVGFGTPKFDPAMWGMDLGQPGTPNFLKNLDYFSMNPNQQAQVVAPEELSTGSTIKVNATMDDAAAPTAPAQPAVKVPKKRGRKRKVLDEKAQAIERKKFLERNRVAANRCRERKKTYVSNLESRQKDILSKNQFLRHELESLSEEVNLLKQMVHVKCACSEDVLVENLRAGLRESTQSSDDIEEVVAKFKSMRATGVTAGTRMDTLLKQMGSPSSTSSHDDDDIFSTVGDGEEHASSTQSSPVELAEAKDMEYPALEDTIKV